MNDGLRNRRPDVSNGGADAPGAAKVDSGGWGTLDLMRRVKGAAADALLDLRAMWAHVTVVLGLVFWVGGLYGNILACVLASICLTLSSTRALGIGILTTQALLIAAPLCNPPAFCRRWLSFVIREGVRFFPMTLRMEDGGRNLVAGRPYVIGFEPHSALPFAMPGVFSEYSGLMPPALKGVRTVASSALFYVPILRHFWYWLGVRRADRATMNQLLSEKTAVVLCPGGVQECLHMEQGSEVCYLRRRHGFIRIALRHGADLVPAFAFGQSYMYSWWKPGPPYFHPSLIARISRTIGFLPLVILGSPLVILGSPLLFLPTAMPHKVPVTVVLGKPIPVPQIANPDHETVDKYLNIFIDAMSALVEEHKAKAGYADMPLIIK